MANARKICCVGFQKTGTTSLTVAFRSMGYSVGQAFKRINEVLDPKAPDARDTIVKIALEQLGKKDVIQDSPSAFVFDEYDKAFPGSKFILTSRPVDAWMKSYAGYFSDKNNPLRTWMYGVETFSGNEDRVREIYETQNQKIRDYFKDRPEDFLEIDLTQGHGWYEVISFLGKDMMPEFPRANTQSDMKKRVANKKKQATALT